MKEMKELAEIVQAIYPLSDDALNLLVRHARTRLVSKKELLIKEGELNSSFYLVKCGILRFFYFAEAEDREYTFCFAVSGDAVLSLHSYFAGLPAMCSIEALADTELFEFSKNTMEYLFTSSLDLANWGRVLAFEEIYSLERRYTFVGTGDAYSRYKSFIKMRSNEVFFQIPLKYIAAYLGVTPQTLSKMRQRFAKE